MNSIQLAQRDLMKADMLGGRLGIPQEIAMKVLRNAIKDDEWFAQLVHDTITKTGTESTEALLRLLYTLGVGTIIEGRMN